MKGLLVDNHTSNNSNSNNRQNIGYYFVISQL